MINKKATFLFFIFISFILVYFLFKNNSLINIYLEKFFIEVFNYKDKNYLNFITIIFLLNFIYFLTPLPVFPIILFNGFVFGNIGFLISMFFICLGSVLIYIFSRNVFKKKISNINFSKYIKFRIAKYNYIKKANNYIVFFSRYFIPYFFHNIIFAFSEISVKRFFIIIMAAEVPLTLATNKIGKSLNNFILNEDYITYNLFFDYQFILSLLFVLFIVLIAGVIEKFTIKKFN